MAVAAEHATLDQLCVITIVALAVRTRVVPAEAKGIR